MFVFFLGSSVQRGWRMVTHSPWKTSTTRPWLHTSKQVNLWKGKPRFNNVIQSISWNSVSQGYFYWTIFSYWIFDHVKTVLRNVLGFSKEYNNNFPLDVTFPCFTLALRTDWRTTRSWPNGSSRRPSRSRQKTHSSFTRWESLASKIKSRIIILIIFVSLQFMKSFTLWNLIWSDIVM